MPGALAVEPPALAATAADGDPLLDALRRIMRLAEGAGEPEAIFSALAHELFAVLETHPPAHPPDEVHVHHLSVGEGSRSGQEGASGGQPGGQEGASGGPGWQEEASGAPGGQEEVPVEQEGEPVVVYLFEGEGRLSYLAPLAERPPGIAWVASTGQSVLAVGARELAASVPRLAAAGGAVCALLLPLAVRGEVEAVVVLARRRPEAFDGRTLQRAAALVDQAANALALLRARAEAGTDAVTGCMNHRAMRRRLREEIGRAARSDGDLACLLLDLDDFKLVNDRHGHPAGDALLREVARALMGEFRAFDRVARYGGDEFVVILPNADLESAAQAAARALQRLAAVPSFDLTPGVAASIGVAQWRAPMTAEQLLAACDDALLRSKRAGKGRVELAVA